MNRSGLQSKLDQLNMMKMTVNLDNVPKFSSVDDTMWSLLDMLNDCQDPKLRSLIKSQIHDYHVYPKTTLIDQYSELENQADESDFWIFKDNHLSSISQSDVKKIINSLSKSIRKELNN